MNLAPIVLFTYNRPIHTQQTVEALLKNEYAAESDLIVYSDAPKNEDAADGVLKTRQYIKTITGFKSVKLIERTENLGLANNIIDGVTTVVNEYGRIIVLEDDLLTSPYFLKFMNEGLEKYETIKEVVSVHGYLYPLKKAVPVNFFLKHTDSLGWGTWASSWEVFNPNGRYLLKELESKKLIKEFNFNNSLNFTKTLRQQIHGKNNSWAIRWYASAFLAEKLSFFPNKSFVFHNGNDNLGTNCDNSDSCWLDVELSECSIPIIDIPIEENKDVRKTYEAFFRSVHGNIINRIKKKIIQIYGKIH